MLFDIDYIKWLASKNLVTVNRHESGLYLFKYSREAEYSWAWFKYPILKRTRGIVLDELGQCYAYVMPKFFNLEEVRKMSQMPTSNNYRIFEKMDGSMINIFNYEGEWIFASSGSFYSEHSDMAKVIFESKYEYSMLNPDLNYVFELIFPENKIVVNYGEIEDLFLITAFDRNGNEYMSEYDRLAGVMSRVKEHEKEDFDVLKSRNLDNEEGYVIRYDNGYRLKIKFEKYFELHALFQNISTTNIWRALCGIIDMKDIFDQCPDEIFDWVKEKIEEYTSKCNDILKNGEEAYHYLFDKVAHIEDVKLKRKTFAKLANEYTGGESGNFDIIMGFYSKRDRERMWKETMYNLKPVYEKPRAF